MFKQRMLIQLSVRGDIRFISHHDLMRVVGRAVRRAGFSVAMSEGFNPRQRIALLLARGVGVASESEFAEIDFTDWVSAETVLRRLNENLPEGLKAERAMVAHPREHHGVAGIEYRVDFRGPVEMKKEDVQKLLDSEEVWVERERKKSARGGGVRRVNIRPFIRDLRLDERRLEVSLRVGEKGTTRPEEIWKALGLTSEAFLAHCVVTRTAMELSPPVRPEGDGPSGGSRPAAERIYGG